MDTNKDFKDQDTYMSKKILEEFKGKVILVVCESSKGTCKYKNKKKCKDCNGEGDYEIQF